jgi:hypothetical protein
MPLSQRAPSSRAGEGEIPAGTEERTGWGRRAGWHRGRGRRRFPRWPGTVAAPPATPPGPVPDHSSHSASSRIATSSQKVSQNHASKFGSAPQLRLETPIPHKNSALHTAFSSLVVVWAHGHATRSPSPCRGPGKTSQERRWAVTSRQEPPQPTGYTHTCRKPPTGRSTGPIRAANGGPPSPRGHGASSHFRPTDTRVTLSFRPPCGPAPHLPSPTRRAPCVPYLCPSP